MSIITFPLHIFVHSEPKVLTVFGFWAISFFSFIVYPLMDTFHSKSQIDDENGPPFLRWDSSFLRFKRLKLQTQNIPSFSECYVTFCWVDRNKTGITIIALILIILTYFWFWFDVVFRFFSPNINFHLNC